MNNGNKIIQELLYRRTLFVIQSNELRLVILTKMLKVLVPKSDKTVLVRHVNRTDFIAVHSFQ
ncbi:MAG: hypothetical protein ACFWTM_02320 [Mitsuokella multacida]|jgi:hypothetical protein